MAGAIINIQESAQNSIFNVFQEPFKMRMEKNIEEYQKGSIIPVLFDMQSMDTFQEEYRSTTGMDGFDITNDMEIAPLSDIEESYNVIYRTRTWANSFSISKLTMEDGQIQSELPRALNFINGYGRTREQYACALIGSALGTVTTWTKKDGKTVDISANGKGMDTTDGTITGTKQQYFHNAHKPAGYSSTSGDPRNFTQSNKFYTTLNFTGTDPEIELKLGDIFQQVIDTMAVYKADKGEIMGTNPTTIIVNKGDTKLKEALYRMLKSKFGSPMAGNGVNLQYGIFTVFESAYLSAISGFAVADHSIILVDPMANKELQGAVWKDRIPLTIRSYVTDGTEANVWTARARYDGKFGDFKPISYLCLGGTQTTNATALTALSTSIQSVSVISSTENPVYTDEVPIV